MVHDSHIYTLCLMAKKKKHSHNKRKSAAEKKMTTVWRKKKPLVSRKWQEKNATSHPNMQIRCLLPLCFTYAYTHPRDTVWDMVFVHTIVPIALEWRTNPFSLDVPYYTHTHYTVWSLCRFINKYNRINRVALVVGPPRYIMRYCIMYTYCRLKQPRWSLFFNKKK